MEIDTIGIDLGMTELIQHFRHEKVFNSRSYRHSRPGEPMQREVRNLRPPSPKRPAGRALTRLNLLVDARPQPMGLHLFQALA